MHKYIHTYIHTCICVSVIKYRITMFCVNQYLSNRRVRQMNKRLFNDITATRWLNKYQTEDAKHFPVVVRKETRYIFNLARDLLYAFSHRQASTHHDLWYTSDEALVGHGNHQTVGQLRWLYLAIRLSQTMALPRGLNPDLDRDDCIS